MIRMAPTSWTWPAGPTRTHALSGPPGPVSAIAHCDPSAKTTIARRPAIEFRKLMP
jgi:hypothetical protein